MVGALHSRRQRPRRRIGAAGHGASRVLSSPSEPSSILTRDGDVPDRSAITPPAEVADRLNQLFPYNTTTEQFATMIYGVLDAEDRGVSLRLRGPPRPRASARRGGAGDSWKPRVPDRSGGGRLRGAVRPTGGRRQAVPLLGWRYRDDGPHRCAVRRCPAPGGDRPRPVCGIAGECRRRAGRGRAVARHRECSGRHLHRGSRGPGRIRAVRARRRSPPKLA